MPIVDVEIITRPDEPQRPDLAVELADRAGEVFGSAPGNTWVKVHFISGDNYAENLAAPGSVFPVFVSVLKAKLPAPDLLQAEAARLTAVIARACQRPPENVHILYLPEGAGRAAFGGRLLAG